MSSTRYAGLLAGSYVILAGAYIIVSGYLAAGASHSVEELRRIEAIKGVTYVAVTALLIFAGARWAMRKMERDARELTRREQALLVNEGRVFAGLIAATVAHDANNVLMVALGEIEAMQQDDGRGGEPLARLAQSVKRLTALNQRLLDTGQVFVARDGVALDVREAARESVDLLRAQADVRRCRISFGGASGLIVTASPALMHQMVGNLVLNAAQAAGDHGVVEVRVAALAGQAAIEVHDSGPGVPTDRREDLFTALATTKPLGSGLGLFSVKACANGLGGRVEVDDSPLGGALFRILLPLAPAKAPAPPAPVLVG